MGAIYKDGIWYGMESTGHSIRGNGQDMYPRDVLSFTGFDVRDDSVNAETDIQAHKMTPAEWDGIFNAAPRSTPLLGGGVNPTGTIISFMGIIVPAGYLKCDGATYNITLYPDLAKHFEDNFGSKNYFGGDGTTTFKVPDLQGEFLRGTGTNGHTDQGDGASVGTHQDGTGIPNYGVSTGEISAYPHATNGAYLENVDKYYGDTSGAIKANKSGGWSGTYKTHGTVRPTNTSVLYCIKY